jgi:hypothetical protein
MSLRDVIPVKTERAGDGGANQGTVDIPPDPIDIALDALAVFLDTTTTTRQRTDAAKAIAAARERRARDRPETP